MITPLIFAGTTEGKEIALFFNENRVKFHIFTATDYGIEVLPFMEYAEVHAGRLSYEDMKQLMQSYKNDEIIIIDATHPYADIVTNNLYSCANDLGIDYYRIIRPSTYDLGKRIFQSVDEAVDYLRNTEGNILLLTGSKDLGRYSEIGDLSRIFARVLPGIDVIKNAVDLGYSLKNIICMQGPFSLEMNIAVINHVQAKYIVTKDTGKAGGFDEKIKAAELTGAELIVIKRPDEKAGGYSIEDLKGLLKDKYILGD